MAIYLRDLVYDHILVDDIASDITKGAVALVNDIYVFYPEAVDVSEDDTSIAITKAKQAKADKKTGTGESINAGERVYGDPADSYKVSATKSSGFKYLGIAKEDASASDTDVLIEYDGTLSDIL